MRILFLLGLFALSAVTVIAQAEWSIVDNCMGDLNYPLVPKGNWDFSGVIISSVHPDGVRGIRADLNVDYYLALEADDSFPAVGAVSPDGRYFAYPIGHTSFQVNSSGSDLLGVEYLRVVRTDGSSDESYRFEAFDFAYTGVIRSFHLRQTLWFGANRVHYPSNDVVDYLFHIPSGESQAWVYSVNPYDIRFVSPDGTRAFDTQLYDLSQDTHIDYSMTQQIFWFPDSSAFMAADGEAISIVSRDGELLDTIPQAGFIDVVIAPNGRFFAIWDEQQNLFLGDIESQILYDLCFQGNIEDARDIAYYFANLAWSPDSQSLAFSYDNYLVILNIQTFENQVLDHYSRQVMAWVPLEGETVSQTEIQIHEPN